jgi:hypothetical protein
MRRSLIVRLLRSVPFHAAWLYPHAAQQSAACGVADHHDFGLQLAPIKKLPGAKRFPLIGVALERGKCLALFSILVLWRSTVCAFFIA